MHALKIARHYAVYAVASVLFLSFLPAAFAAAPIPVVAGPIPATSDSYPFDAAHHSAVPQNLSQFGYVEEEYLVSGAANVYTLDSTGKASLRTPNAAYTTRILVRRPASPQGFSGTAVVEILNSTGGYDVDYQWHFLRDYLLDHKIAWVGVTSKPVAAKALKTFDPTRYAAISWANPLPPDKTCAKPGSILGDASPATEDGLVWDILSQVGSLVRSGSPQNPLKGLPVDKVYLVGYSQSGGFVVTYVNFIRPLPSATLENGKPVFDAYFNGDGDGLYALAPALDQCSPPPQMGDPRFVVRPRPEPMITIVSQTRVGTSFAERRPDSDSPVDRYRRYEVPGASHTNQRELDLSPTRADKARTGVPYQGFDCTGAHRPRHDRLPLRILHGRRFFQPGRMGSSGMGAPESSVDEPQKSFRGPLSGPRNGQVRQRPGRPQEPVCGCACCHLFRDQHPRVPRGETGLQPFGL